MSKEFVSRCETCDWYKNSSTPSQANMLRNIHIEQNPNHNVFIKNLETGEKILVEVIV